MPPEACSGAGAMRRGDGRDELGANAPGARAVEVDEVDRAARPPRRSARERDGLARPLDDLVVGALVQPDGAAAEHVDGRDHLDRLCDTSMLPC